MSGRLLIPVLLLVVLAVTTALPQRRPFGRQATTPTQQGRRGGNTNFRRQFGAQQQQPVVEESPESKIVSNEFTKQEDGSYTYRFETTDPIVQEVNGTPKQFGEDDVRIIMSGSYSFTAKDNEGNDVPVTITWVADENGFRADGDAVPKPLPEIVNKQKEEEEKPKGRRRF